tara:strand:- start:342 stop:1778 length:1437 start_codon:yes stop_codon:yes gene_type:complete
MQEQTGQTTGWSRKTTLLVNALLALVSLLLFAGLELYLRHTHYGLDDRLFIPVRHATDTSFTYQLNQELHRKYYFNDPILEHLVPRIGMKYQKSERDFRVFCLGGSTTGGPFPKLLHELLVRSEVGRAVEVVNLGIITFNSYQVLDIARKLPQYDPDLLIVYMGHNEIYGPLGVASNVALGTSREVINLVLHLRDIKVFQLANSFYSRLRAPSDRSGKRGSPYEMMVNSTLAPHHPSRKQAVGNFKGNLQEIIEIAERHGIPVILGTVVSNLRDWRPFDSALPPDSLDVAQWQHLLDVGERALELNHLDEAERSYQTALRLFPDHAQTHFDLGHVYLALGQRDRAELSFTRARDLDVLPIRAPSGVNEAIRSVAGETGTILVDFEAVFQNYDPESVVGKPVIYEHLHPTILGDYLIASRLTDVILNEGFLAANEGLSFEDPSLKRELGISEDRVDVRRLRHMMRVWPFNINNEGYSFP